RNSQQLDQRFDAPDVQRLTELANKPGAQLTADEQQWLGARIDPRGPHLIGLYGLGYFTAEEKLRVDSEREARKKAKDAEAQQAKAAAAAAAAAARPKDPVAPPAGATAPAPPPQPPGGAAS
ncbi:MAG TPA: hypothetical protein VK348_05455, partial [Planctomycetota bacterium]|nr:hypothetical protein [Planctomycetota bacterium]